MHNNHAMDPSYFSHNSWAEASAAQHNAQHPGYSLGVSLPTAHEVNRYSFFAEPTFAQSPHSFFANLSLQHANNPAASAPELVKDIGVELTKLPGSMTTGLLVLDAAKIGYELSVKIKKDLDGGMPLLEAATCRTTSTLVEHGLDSVGKSAIIGGIVPYAAAVVEYPPLLLTAPAVGVALPEAYHNVGVASQMAGNIVEQGCHDAFAAARQFSRGGK